MSGVTPAGHEHSDGEVALMNYVAAGLAHGTVRQHLYYLHFAVRLRGAHCGRLRPRRPGTLTPYSCHLSCM